MLSGKFCDTTFISILGGIGKVHLSYITRYGPLKEFKIVLQKY